MAVTVRRPTTELVPILSIVFVALTLGLSFAHVLEIAGKLRLDAGEWLTVQQNLYVAFGVVGAACELLAIAFTWLAAWRRRRDGGRATRLTWTAAIAVSTGLAVWAAVVSPMNTVLSAWTPEAIPANWTDVRNRWELGHAMQAALFLCAFINLLLAQQANEADPLRDGHGARALHRNREAQGTAHHD